MGEEDKSTKKVYQLVGFGVGITVQVVAGALIGYYLDQKLNTQPWLLLMGTVGGFFLSLRTLFRTLKRL